MSKPIAAVSDTWTLVEEAAYESAVRCRDCAAELRTASRTAAVLAGKRPPGGSHLIFRDGLIRQVGAALPTAPLLTQWLRLERTEGSLMYRFDYCTAHGTPRRIASALSGRNGGDDGEREEE